MTKSLTELTNELTTLGAKRLSLFSKASYESLTSSWQTEVEPNELVKLRAQVKAYLSRNRFWRFFQWLFSSIHRSVELLAYYEAKQVLSKPEEVSAESLSYLQSLASGLSRGLRLRALLTDIVAVLSGAPAASSTAALPSANVPVATVSFCVENLFSASSTDPMKCYERLGLSIQSSLAEIVKAYRSKVRSLHSDKGGKDAAFVELHEAYLLAAYIRVEFFKEKDTKSILRTADLPQLNAEVLPHLQRIYQAVEQDLQARLTAVEETISRAEETISRAEETTSRAEETTSRAEETTKDAREMTAQYNVGVVAFTKEMDYVKAEIARRVQAGELETTMVPSAANPLEEATAASVSKRPGCTN